MRRLVDRFGEQAVVCGTLTDLKSLIGDVTRELGFDHFALLHHASLNSIAAPPGLVRIDNYPEGWAAELLKAGLAADDPVHVASRRVNTGFAWAEIGAIIPLTSRHRTILSRSRHFGIGEGFTVPVNVPQEPAGSCSFATRRGRDVLRRIVRLLVRGLTMLHDCCSIRLTTDRGTPRTQRYGNGPRLQG
jgi:LuxR family quorum-sensing system transcriptional regulator CciR